MQFEKHLFISYSHIDNEALTPDEKGWVTRFHASLEKFLSMRLGRRVVIWRDSKLRGTDVFAEEILSQFPQTAVLVSVVSPRYVDSEWCVREAEAFCRAADQTGGAVVNNKSRIVKVVKTPAPTEETLPALMRQVLPYPFYILENDNTPLELDTLFGPEMGAKYHVKVATLASHIADVLRILAPERNKTALQPSSRPAVYLAETSYDQREAREAIESELRAHGYPVLPEGRMSRDEDEYLVEVARSLERAKLSVHIVGAKYGAVPDGPSGKSIAALQNEAAIKRCREASIQRIIWTPDGIQPDSPAQRDFVTALHNDPAAQFGADLLNGGIETLKAAIHAALRKIEQPPPEPPSQESGLAKIPKVYLICSEKDRLATAPLHKFLKERKLAVQTPLFQGEAATIRQANAGFIRECGAVLIFYGEGDESWLHTMQTDLIKNGADRATPLPESYLYLPGPSTPHKEYLIAIEEPNVIDCVAGFAPDRMEPFLRSIRTTVQP